MILRRLPYHYRSSRQQICIQWEVVRPYWGLQWRCWDLGAASERANWLRSVLLHPPPEVAARKSTENSRPPCLRPFALKRVENLFDAVSHRFRSGVPGRRRPTREWRHSRESQKDRFDLVVVD